MLDHPKQDARPLTSFVTYRLARAHYKLSAQAIALLKANSELTLVEWRIIQLLRMQKTAQLSTLANAVRMDKGQLSRKISALIKKGLVTSTPDEHDHRKQNLCLTADAGPITDVMMPIMLERQRKLLENVAEDDLAIFYKVLEQIEAAADDRGTA